MAEESAAKFSCPACGKQYTWKPELAGRRAKCKCGQAIQVPAAPPGSAAGSKPPAESEAHPAAKAPAPPPPPRAMAKSPAPAPAPAPAPGAVNSAGPADATGGDSRCPSCGQPLAAGAVICVGCGFNLKTGKHLSTSIGEAETDA